MEKREIIDGKLQLKKQVEYNSIMTESFRELVDRELGKLDVAKSFMYLFAKYGAPTFSVHSDSKVLFDYRFFHEDLLISIHGSYHEFVYFSLHIPQKRMKEFSRRREQFTRDLYLKYENEIPFMPYAQLPWGKGYYELTSSQNKKNWGKINAEYEKFFSKEEAEYIEAELMNSQPDRQVWQKLQPFEKRLCEKFRSQLSEEEIEKINNWNPSIEDISGLKKQCLDVINEVKKGVWVRDVQFNILGYESETNEIPIELE